VTESLALASAYATERALGARALEEGRLEDAGRHLAEALRIARRTGDHDLVDRAVCGEAAVAIALRPASVDFAPLREILLRNPDPDTCSLSAYNIARLYELRRDYRKSLFYARLTRDRAEMAGNTQRLAVALNQIGNANVGLSAFDEAIDHYRRALELVGGGSGWYMLCLANLGYCLVVKGNLSEGMGLLYRVLRYARRVGEHRLEMMSRLDLCFAHLEAGRAATAERHVTRGLALARELGELHELKNALYLSGQNAVVSGRIEEARSAFAELQARFYPEQTSLVDFLLSVDISKTMNLRA
jgi:tetratricopeptide (TPR) repeat protein